MFIHMVSWKINVPITVGPNLFVTCSELLAEKRGKASINMRVIKDNEKAKKERKEAEKVGSSIFNHDIIYNLANGQTSPHLLKAPKYEFSSFTCIYTRHSRALPAKVPQSPYPMHAWIAFSLCRSSKYNHVLMALCLSSSILGNWNMTSAENLEKENDRMSPSQKTCRNKSCIIF